MLKLIYGDNDEGRQFLEKLLERSKEDRANVAEIVREIIENVKKNGDSALKEYTRLFDGVEIPRESVKVTEKELSDAYGKVDSKLVEVIRRAKENIEKFHSKQKENSWFSTESEGIILGQMYRPLETVGVYVPGGTAPLPSSVLMNVIPARVAGVERIIMATPPSKDGSVNPVILVAACEAGVDEIFKVGGAQAVAAMAVGTESIPKVDKIVGPGNIYVATAKRMVFGMCDIDMVAGPSEILVIADESANASYVAADLLSQAEHDTMASSILVTVSGEFAKKVQKEIERQVQKLSRKDIIIKSLENYGAAIVVENIRRAVEIANMIAPEHLELCVNEPFNLLGDIKNAGAIFLGHYAPEPLGDYFAGPNHVLPTSGTAKFFSPLNVGDFVKKSSVISYTRKALRHVAEDVILFAKAEGLTAHANAVSIRFE
ncbi:MAG TPA: histidinol dehydrogenase [Clostridiaceae bacterium]|nr:histidinol dehydrogenase [Clostridiaceae bacterium]